MDGNGSLMEVEGGWKWKVDGSGSMEIVVDGPNEPPYMAVLASPNQLRIIILFTNFLLFIISLSGFINYFYISSCF